ncbi:MAG: H4MPT-linked C1 transfer pathway protein [Planctomycetota bacterium]|nr:H4MPT-linked C1 transfer pathway protein [Planctomycetota bacterium]
MYVIGLDIGGANIKVADNDRQASAQAFKLWMTPEKTGDTIVGMLKPFGRPDALAVTMTGELADCFRTKAEGVDRILSEVERIAETPVFVWQTGAEFVQPDVAREIPLLVSAANWHALATWLGRMVPSGNSLLIDIGSTTADIIPILDGLPIAAGMTDIERLKSSELVYTGVRRTPVCSLAHTVPLEEGQCAIAAEVFATMLDVNLVLGEIPEDHDNTDTANGRPATIPEAVDRLSRMLCCDRTEVTTGDIRQMATFFSDVQLRLLRGALDRVLSALTAEVETVIVAGGGQFLAERLVQSHPRVRSASVHRLSDQFDGDSSVAACAVAVARLGSERLRL